MKISIIIPAYNAERYIEECIESIALAMDENQLEIIIIDDGSTDLTLQILEKLKENYYPLIKYISQENSGISKARNAGLDIARGEYVLFVDSDDRIEADYFNDLVESDLIVTPYDDILADSVKHNIYEYHGFSTEREQVGKMLGKINLAYVWGKFFKRSIIEENCLRFDNSLQYGEDSVFVLQYCTYIRSCYVRNEGAYLFTHHAGESLSKRFVQNLEQYFESESKARRKLYEKYDSYRVIFEDWCPNSELVHERIKIRNIFRKNSPYKNISSKTEYLKRLYANEYIRPEKLNYMLNTKLDLILNILLLIKSPQLTVIILSVILR